MNTQRQLSVSEVGVVLGLIGGAAMVVILLINVLDGRQVDGSMVGVGLFMTALMGSACYRGSIWATKSTNLRTEKM